jgi:hypothetical protein
VKESLKWKEPKEQIVLPVKAVKVAKKFVLFA